MPQKLKYDKLFDKFVPGFNRSFYDACVKTARILSWGTKMDTPITLESVYDYSVLRMRQENRELSQDIKNNVFKGILLTLKEREYSKQEVSLADLDKNRDLYLSRYRESGITAHELISQSGAPGSIKSSITPDLLSTIGEFLVLQVILEMK